MIKVGFGVTVLERARSVGGIDGIGIYTSELLNQFSKLDQQVSLYPFTVGVSKLEQNLFNSDAFRFPNFKFSVFNSSLTWLPFIGGTKFAAPLNIIHATDHYIPYVGKTPLVATLMDAIEYFYKKTKNRISYEYVALSGVNDTIEDARNLVKLCKRFPVRLNIIEYNSIGDGLFEKSESDTLDRFAEYLTDHEVTVTVRRSRGKDIDAACGQLANKE